ncbi:polysaccharide exporter lipoprotein precursor [Flavobacterium enshiense DK69]|nr:polysaccharide exporter lipoprotein precursor [Flavobacterium enshiense DK69]
MAFTVLTVMCSCASRKKMAYLQPSEVKSEKNLKNEDINEKKEKSLYEPIIQNDDLLHIIVSAENPEVAAPYNLKSVSVNNVTGNTNINQNQLEAYLVDKNGEIEFPQLGKMKLAGLTRLEAVEKIKKQLTDYIQNPTVYISIVNFKVSVLGEVTRPGSHTISSERITLLEALSLSGDLTVYGKRENIMVIREKSGEKTIATVDITKADFIHSPYYYLSQNDVIYVEANRVKMGSSLVGPSVTVGLSVLSIALGIILIAVN